MPCRPSSIIAISSLISLSSYGKTSIYNHAWLVDSKHHAGIQLADLAIGALGRLVAGDTKKAKAEAYWEMLRGHFIIDEYLANVKLGK